MTSNSADRSNTNMFQPPLASQRREATMAANSAVWIVHASNPYRSGSLDATGSVTHSEEDQYDPQGPKPLRWAANAAPRERENDPSPNNA
eukprot:16340884-Heterocapsa_arctica.AAC.1